MMAWEKVKLQKVLEINIPGEWGKDPVEGSQTSINIIRTTNFSNDGRIDFSNIIKREVDLKKIEQKKLKYGDIIIEKSGGSPTQPVGRVIFFDLSSEDIYLCNNFTAILRCNNKVFPKYLLYYLLNAHKRNKTLNFQNKTTGIINLQLSRYINELEIPLPPINTQIKIAEALDKAQELIDNKKMQFKKYDELIQSIFIEMFGDPMTNSKGWKLSEVNKFSEIITGNTPSRQQADNYGNYIEWIKSDNINTPYTYITQASESLSEKGALKGRIIEKNAILMTCIAGSLSCIGNVAITNRKVAFNQQINGLVPKKNINLFFMYRLMIEGKKIIQNASTRGMKGMVSKGVLSELKFILPPLSLQEKFASVAEKVEEEKILCEKSLKQMEENFNSMIDKAFKGELF